MSRSPEPVPPEVASFAAREGVDNEMPKLLEVTRRVFPLGQIQLRLDGPGDDRHIRVEVAGTNYDDYQASKAQMVWTDEVFKNCDPTLVCVFRLAVV
jgi:hypothetical protein